VTRHYSGESHDGGVFNGEETGFAANQIGNVFSTSQALGINRQNGLNVVDPSSSNFGHGPSIEHPDSDGFG
jgi:hypothetical protein